MLATMFGKDSQWASATDANGAYLLDRTPEYFAPLLHYLRTGRLIVDSSVSLEGVLDEAQYFQIHALVEEIEARLQEAAAASAVTFSRKELTQLLAATSSHERLRFQGLNLQGVDLSNLDLRNINFRGCNLREAKLEGSNCDMCVFDCADLRQANLNVRLCSFLSSAPSCDAHRPTLKIRALQGAKLRSASFARANLEGALMRGCDFEDSRTGRSSTLEGANLKDADLEDSNLPGANFRVASLRNAKLRNCMLRGTLFAGADLENCDLMGSNIEKVNFRNANLRGAIFDGKTPVPMSMLSMSRIS